MTSFFDTLTAYKCLVGYSFNSVHAKILIISHPNSDDAGISVL